MTPGDLIRMVACSTRAVLLGCSILLANGALVGCTASQAHSENLDSPPATRPAAPVVEIERAIIGRSVEGKAIEMVRFGHGASPILVIAAIHGNEPTSRFVAERLIESLSRCPSANVAVVPCANPDGLEADRRTNAHGVDLNRNFPATNWKRTHLANNFGGRAPLSEPESAALLHVIEAIKPRLIISIHSMEHPCNNYDGPGEAIAQTMSQDNGYPTRSTIGYPTPGSLGSWAGIDHNIPIITLELPRHQPGEQAWTANRVALMTICSEK